MTSLRGEPLAKRVYPSHITMHPFVRRILRSKKSVLQSFATGEEKIILYRILSWCLASRFQYLRNSCTYPPKPTKVTNNRTKESILKPNLFHGPHSLPAASSKPVQPERRLQIRLATMGAYFGTTRVAYGHLHLSPANPAHGQQAISFLSPWVRND